METLKTNRDRLLEEEMEGCVDGGSKKTNKLETTQQRYETVNENNFSVYFDVCSGNVRSK